MSEENPFAERKKRATTDEMGRIYEPYTEEPALSVHVECAEWPYNDELSHGSSIARHGRGAASRNSE